MSRRKRHGLILFVIWLWSVPTTSLAGEGWFPARPIPAEAITLQRLAQPGMPFDKVGRRFALLGEEGGSFEAWAYPLKLLRNFQLSFFLGSSTRPLLARDLVREIRVSPAVTWLRYTYQSFTVDAYYVTPVFEPGALILLKVQAVEPLTIVAQFLPVLQPMWPAGLGGQYAYWEARERAFIISEPTGKNHGLVGSPAAQPISRTPAHMLADQPHEFKIEIHDPLEIQGKMTAIVLAGGKGPRDSVLAVYRRLSQNPFRYLQQNIAYYRDYLQNTLQVITPDDSLNLAFAWARVALDNLLVDNPDLGLGMVAGLHASGTSGRPGFGWFFGGDAFMNVLALNSFGAYQAAGQVLAFNRQWQRQDGKMAHELSQAAGYIRWWEDYPYGYIHADTTPWYLVASWDYFRHSGDRAFLQQAWSSLLKAYRWCLSTDGDGDGLMDNRLAGLGAFEYGELTNIQTDIFLAAVWLQALRAMEQLAEEMGKTTLASEARSRYEQARKSFHRRFWHPEGYYSYAFNADGQQVAEPTPWSGVGLMWRHVQPRYAWANLTRVQAADFTTDWGVRMLSERSRFYHPLEYNYGAVWPFVTGFWNLAQFVHHQSVPAFSLLRATAWHTFDHGLGTISELFTGAFNSWLQETVAHQGFSSTGLVLPLVRGLLGLEWDALKGRIFFRPQLPAHWDSLQVHNLRCGDGRLELELHQAPGEMFLQVSGKGARGLQLVFAPVLAPGTEIMQVLIDGQAAEWDGFSTPYSVQPQIAVPLENDSVDVRLYLRRGVELIPPRWPHRIGESNRGLKVLSFRLLEDKNICSLLVAGLAGNTYRLELRQAHLIEKVEGARREGNHLVIEFPGKQKGFQQKEIRLWRTTR